MPSVSRGSRSEIGDDDAIQLWLSWAVVLAVPPGDIVVDGATMFLDWELSAAITRNSAPPILLAHLSPPDLEVTW